MREMILWFISHQQGFSITKGIKEAFSKNTFCTSTSTTFFNLYKSNKIMR